MWRYCLEKMVKNFSSMKARFPTSCGIVLKRHFLLTSLTNLVKKSHDLCKVYYHRAHSCWPFYRVIQMRYNFRSTTTDKRQQCKWGHDCSPYLLRSIYCCACSQIIGAKGPVKIIQGFYTSWKPGKNLENVKINFQAWKRPQKKEKQMWKYPGKSWKLKTY